MYNDLITSLREDAEWAEANEWEIPIMLPTHLRQAVDAIEELSAKATPKRVGFAGWKGCRDTRYKCPYCNKYVRKEE